MVTQYDRSFFFLAKGQEALGALLNPHRLIEGIKQEGKEGQALWPGSLRLKSRAFGAPCAWPRGLLHVAIAPPTGGHVANGV